MTKTENYNLPQWEAGDPVRREDFNQAMAGIESGLTAAQQTADSAETTAGAAYCPDYKPYVVGSYTGTGAPMTITLGFRPSFLIIGGALFDTSSPADYDLISAGNVLPEVVAFTDTGFRLLLADSSKLPRLTISRWVYDYIAFR